jgi:dienelactone hydrolase
LLGGSEGGDSFSPIAPLFAKHGYVTASVAYFGEPGLPQTLVNIPVETVGNVVKALTARTDVNGKIGIAGMSRGGEFSLLAGSTYPQIKAVVAVVPSPIAYMGLGQYNIPTGCAWSKDTKALPCVPADDAANQKIYIEAQTNQPLKLTPLYEASRKANAAVTRAAFFPLEKIRGPVLCLGGQDDEMWNSSGLCDLAVTYLRKHKHAFADREINYPNAGHMFLLAMGGPKSSMLSFTAGPTTVLFGGTAEGDAAASNDAWAQIWAFLGTSLGK